MNNYLILRTLTSPYSDVTKGSVLSQAELDDNFIFLKGNVIYTAETSGTNVTLKKYNGDSFTFVAGGSGIFTGGTIVGPTVFTNGATANTLTVNGVSITGDTYTIGSTLIGTTAYFDTNTTLSAYTLDLSSIVSSSSFTGGTVNGPTSFTAGLTANSLTVNGVVITGDSYVTSYGYDNANTFTIGRNNGLPDLTATINSVTGLTVNGDLFITGLTSGNTAVFNNLTATTITLNGTSLSAFTDTFVTGGTYSNGVSTYTNNTGGTFDVSATTAYAAGIISGSSGWSNSSGEMNLPAIKVALFNNSINIEPIFVYDIASGTTGTAGISSLTDNDTNYVMVEYNNGSPRYFVSTTNNTNDSDVVLAYIVYRLGAFVHVLEFGDYGAGLANKLNDRIIYTDRFGWESGLNLGLSGSTGVVTLTSGIAWNASFRQSLAAVNSQDDIFFKNYHSGGTWVYTTTGDTLNNSYYDNGTNIVSGTTGKYLVNYYYRGQETNDHLYEVYGTGEYDSVVLAEASSSPELPELVSSHAFLVGRIVVGVGETTGITQTAFGTVFQPSGYAPSSGLHNSLSGLQGGTSGEYYHLTQNQINNLILRYTADVTFASSVQQTITHNLNSQAIVVQLWDSSNKLVNGADIVANAVNTVQITVATGGSYKVVVIG
jgi:hypothetical protein